MLRSGLYSCWFWTTLESQIRRDLRESFCPIACSNQSQRDFWPGISGLCPAGSWKSPRTEIPNLLLFQYFIALRVGNFPLYPVGTCPISNYEHCFPFSCHTLGLYLFFSTLRLLLSPLNVFFSGLNKASSFSLSSQVMHSKPLIILVTLSWTRSSSSTSFSYWESQNCWLTNGKEREQKLFLYL